MPALKRGMDVLLSSAAIVMLSPILLVTAIIVRMSLGAPVIFRQTRPGLGAAPFVMYKFRTMREVSDDTGVPLPDHMRLTRVGQFLRSTSLDELPELVNVLKGDMSLVGPRPLLLEYVPLYTTEQARRHEMRPGITGWAQVHGRNAVSWEDRFKLDVWYIDNHSFSLDLKILLLTVRNVVFREGINQPGRATMDRFRGNHG